MSQEGSQSYEKGEKPAVGSYHGFHHLRFWVGNALQAATYYCVRFGFSRVAYQGLETGSRDVATHVVRKNNIILAFSTPLHGAHEMYAVMNKSGDGIFDIAFAVDDCRAIFAAAVSRGAVAVKEPHELTDDSGSVVVATIKTYGDAVHSFVQLNGYAGPFLPTYPPVSDSDPLLESLPDTDLVCVDHVVGNQPDEQMVPVTDWYIKVLQFHRFWSVDDKALHTQYSALRSIVVADYDEKVKMPINEPAVGLRKSQIQEYVEYYGGAGVQHVALYTADILSSVSALKARGVKFLSVPETYYEDLRRRLAEKEYKLLKEDLDALQRLHILVDFDENGYLLQIFTQPQEDRPTLFFEIIQRNNHWGFGIGNFKALFESIERAQELRGNL